MTNVIVQKQILVVNSIAEYTMVYVYLSLNIYFCKYRSDTTLCINPVKILATETYTEDW